MRKIPTLFQRNYETHSLRNELKPGTEWVAAGEGIATRKWDGTCCLWYAGKLWKRYELKSGKTAPVGFQPAQESPDPVTGKMPGWVPVGDGPEDLWHREALAAAGGLLAEGTYELCGPKIQKNPENLDSHRLIRHGEEILDAVPVEFDALREYLKQHDIEGIVWHHPDGLMAKIKAKDFGLSRNLSARSGRGLGK